MYIAERTLRFVNGFFKSYGPSHIKQILWDKEYSGEKWNFADNTVGDCVYFYLEKYVANGNILDLGCGSGNTANELSTATYHSYVGVDISETALLKAKRRSKENGRTEKNQFVQGDFLDYLPSQQFTAILFRESLYHVPLGQVGATLDHYSKYLKPSGVFIVRINTTDGRAPIGKSRPTAMVDVIKREFDIVEKRQYGGSGPTVIVFRPRSEVRKG